VALLAILIIFSQISIAAPLNGIAELAEKALVRGDLARGKVLLTGLSPEMAAMYKLAWISRLHDFNEAKRPQTVLDEEHRAGRLLWKASTEIWRDEWEAYDAGTPLPASAEPFFATEEEERVVQSVLRNLKEENSSPFLADAILKSSYNEWVVDREAHVSGQGCQREAFDLIGSAEGDLRAWGEKCSHCEGLFCSVAKLELADKLTEESEFSDALEIYVGLAKLFKEIPLALHYRVAALEILAGSPLENQLRASRPIFSSDEANSAHIPEMQKEAIRSHICGEMAYLSPRQLSSVLKKVFVKTTWVRQAREWILTCSEEEASKIARLTSERSLSSMEREFLSSAYKVRKIRRKNQLVASGPNASDLKGGLASRSKSLEGVLRVPVLFPFPKVTFSPEPYAFAKNFSEMVKEKENESGR
jgi:hypothetical protein